MQAPGISTTRWNPGGDVLGAGEAVVPCSEAISPLPALDGTQKCLAGIRVKQAATSSEWKLRNLIAPPQVELTR